MPETALIVVDMLSRYEHEDADLLVRSVEEQLPQIVSLRDRAAAADDVLLLYSNDNFEHWESTRDDLVEDALGGARPDLVEPIVPPKDIPFLPKGRHSIFYETPVAHVLQTQGVKRIVMCGQVTEQCILYSALDAVLRGYEVEIPTDAVAHVVPEFAEAALGMMEKNLHAWLRPAEQVELPASLLTAMDPLIVLFGLGVGILVGLTGIGGGSLMTPLLLLAGGYSPVVTIGTDLAYGAITKTFGGWRHLRAGHVDLRLSWWLAAGSVPGSLVGVLTLNQLHDAHGEDFEPYLLAFVAAALLLAAGATLYRSLFRPDMIKRERAAAGLKRRSSKVATIFIGVVLGFILGLTSVGSGALVGLVLILLYRLNPHRVVGTDVFHAAVLLWSAGLAHLASGNVDLALMATILIGSLPGVWIGTALLPHVPVGGLRHALGIVLAAAALGVLSKAGVPMPPVALIGIPLVLAVFSIVVHRRRMRPPMPKPIESGA